MIKWPFVKRSTHEKALRQREHEIKNLQNHNQNLRIALRAAWKNDSRDPKTGRFVKVR